MTLLCILCCLVVQIILLIKTLLKFPLTLSVFSLQEFLVLFKISSACQLPLAVVVHGCSSPWLKVISKAMPVSELFVCVFRCVCVRVCACVYYGDELIAKCAELLFFSVDFLIIHPAFCSSL